MLKLKQLKREDVVDPYNTGNKINQPTKHNHIVIDKLKSLVFLRLDKDAIRNKNKCHRKNCPSKRATSPHPPNNNNTGRPIGLYQATTQSD